MSYQRDQRIHENSSNFCIKLVTEQAIVVFHRLSCFWPSNLDNSQYELGREHHELSIFQWKCIREQDSGDIKSTPRIISNCVAEYKLHSFCILIPQSITNQSIIKDKRICTCSQNAMLMSSFCFQWKSYFPYIESSYTWNVYRNALKMWHSRKSKLIQLLSKRKKSLKTFSS